jgi:hypothetical protein
VADGQVWRAYRDLCSSEKLWPAEPIEEFVRFMLRNGLVSPFCRFQLGFFVFSHAAVRYFWSCIFNKQ